MLQVWDLSRGAEKEKITMHILNPGTRIEREGVVNSRFTALKERWLSSQSKLITLACLLEFLVANPLKYYFT